MLRVSRNAEAATGGLWSGAGVREYILWFISYRWDYK